MPAIAQGVATGSACGIGLLPWVARRSGPAGPAFLTGKAPDGRAMPLSGLGSDASRHILLGRSA